MAPAASEAEVERNSARLSTLTSRAWDKKPQVQKINAAGMVAELGGFFILLQMPFTGPVPAATDRSIHGHRTDKTVQWKTAHLLTKEGCIFTISAGLVYQLRMSLSHYCF